MNDLTEKIKLYLLDYVKEITEPSRHGGKNQYICPLCRSGTGSHHSGAFTVYPDTNSYHCFACSSNGDIFNLYAEMNNLSLLSDFRYITDELTKKYHLLSSDSKNTQSYYNSESWLQLRSHVYLNMNHDKIAVKTIYKKPDGSKTARWERYEGNTLVKGLNGLKMPLYHVYNLA
ncbi:MAG: CHC2 zinc finger domain-containing protein, partial [Muribaculaceae bacterium]|nr:CHC2 zinc finger domain-containing protein [Muribaculaceae bacterium]